MPLNWIENILRMKNQWPEPAWINWIRVSLYPILIYTENDSAISHRFIDWFVDWWINLCGCIRANTETTYDWDLSTGQSKTPVRCVGINSHDPPKITHPHQLFPQKFDKRTRFWRFTFDARRQTNEVRIYANISRTKARLLCTNQFRTTKF